MRMKLTDGAIRGLLADLGPEGDRDTVRDTELTGFILRVSRQRVATFGLEYRPQGAGRRVSPTVLTVGRWPKLKADAARRIVQGHVVDVSRGHDPMAERRAREAQRSTALKELLAEDGPYERSLRRRKLQNWKVALSALRRGLSPLMARELSTLTRADLVQRITALQDADLPGAAADLRKFSHSLIEWGIQQGHATHNPLSGWKQSAKTRAERLGKQEIGKALDDQELVRVWAAAGTLGTFGNLVRLGLLTAMRRGELASLRWSDIAIDRINLQAGSTKGGRAHAIPLTDLMRGVLASQVRSTSPLIFPSALTGGRIGGWSKLVRKLQEASGVDVRLHDLRRSCRTSMSTLNIPEDDAELAIGHQRADLVRRYNRDEGWQRRAAAFAAVSAHVAALIGREPSRNVVPLVR